MMIAKTPEPMVAVILFAVLAVVVLVAILSRRKQWFAERLEFGRL